MGMKVKSAIYDDQGNVVTWITTVVPPSGCSGAEPR